MKATKQNLRFQQITTKDKTTMTKLFLIALLFVAASCSTEKYAYRVISTTATAVEKAEQAWAEEVVRHATPFEKQTKVRQAINQYRTSMLLASNSVAIYKATGDKNQLTGALNSFSYIASALLNELSPPVVTPTNFPPLPVISNLPQP